MRSTRRQVRGFTLIELLVAITILAVIAVLAWRGLSQVMLGRDRIMDTMSDERVISQLFDQVGVDARQVATDDEVGAPAVSISNQQLQIVRYVRAPGQPPRLQVVRYRQTNGVITRYASAPLDNQVQLRGALSAGVDSNNFTSVSLMSQVTDMSVRLWVAPNGWTRQMKDVDNAIQTIVNNLRVPQLGSAPMPRSVTGIELNVAAAGMPATLRRVFLVGE
jgi:general secretion pathway protein J